MAGGYDGTKVYPESTDYDSTLKLVNDEYFEESAAVSYSSSWTLNYPNTCHSFLFLLLSYLSHQSHIAWLDWTKTLISW